jgi:hypothetical protein
MTGAARPSVDHRSRFLRFFKVGDRGIVTAGLNAHVTGGSATFTVG